MTVPFPLHSVTSALISNAKSSLRKEMAHQERKWDCHEELTCQTCRSVWAEMLPTDKVNLGHEDPWECCEDAWYLTYLTCRSLCDKKKKEKRHRSKEKVNFAHKDTWEFWEDAGMVSTFCRTELFLTPSAMWCWNTSSRGCWVPHKTSHTLKNQNQMVLPTHACKSMYTNTPLTP